MTLINMSMQLQQQNPFISFMVVIHWMKEFAEGHFPVLKEGISGRASLAHVNVVILH